MSNFIQFWRQPHLNVMIPTIPYITELLKVNPMGYVPALVDGTIVISDSYAILLVNLYILSFFFKL